MSCAQVKFLSSWSSVKMVDGGEASLLCGNVSGDYHTRQAPHAMPHMASGWEIGARPIFLTQFLERRYTAWDDTATSEILRPVARGGAVGGGGLRGRKIF